MERREAAKKTTICRFGKKLASTSDHILILTQIEGIFVL